MANKQTVINSHTQKELLTPLSYQKEVVRKKQELRDRKDQGHKNSKLQF